MHKRNPAADEAEEMDAMITCIDPAAGFEREEHN